VECTTTLLRVQADHEAQRTGESPPPPRRSE
jgi:hypothetical protein